MRDHRRIVVGFYGGPLDGWTDERTTDESVFLPETLVSGDVRHSGEYRIVLLHAGHFVYRWHEGARAES